MIRRYEFITVHLVQFEKDFNTPTKKSRVGEWLSQTRPIPRSPDGDNKLSFSKQQRSNNTISISKQQQFIGGK